MLQRGRTSAARTLRASIPSSSSTGFIVDSSSSSSSSGAPSTLSPNPPRGPTTPPLRPHSQQHPVSSSTLVSSPTGGGHRVVQARGFTTSAPRYQQQRSGGSNSPGLGLLDMDDDEFGELEGEARGVGRSFEEPGSMETGNKWQDTVTKLRSYELMEAKDQAKSRMDQATMTEEKKNFDLLAGGGGKVGVDNKSAIAQVAGRGVIQKLESQMNIEVQRLKDLKDKEIEHGNTWSYASDSLFDGLTPSLAIELLHLSLGFRTPMKNQILELVAQWLNEHIPTFTTINIIEIASSVARLGKVPEVAWSWFTKILDETLLVARVSELVETFNIKESFLVDQMLASRVAATKAAVALAETQQTSFKVGPSLQKDIKSTKTRSTVDACRRDRRVISGRIQSLLLALQEEGASSTKIRQPSSAKKTSKLLRAAGGGSSRKDQQQQLEKEDHSNEFLDMLVHSIVTWDDDLVPGMVHKVLPKMTVSELPSLFGALARFIANTGGSQATTGADGKPIARSTATSTPTPSSSSARSIAPSSSSAKVVDIDGEIDDAKETQAKEAMGVEEFEVELVQIVDLVKAVSDKFVSLQSEWTPEVLAKSLSFMSLLHQPSGEDPLPRNVLDALEQFCVTQRTTLTWYQLTDLLESLAVCGLGAPVPAGSVSSTRVLPSTNNRKNFTRLLVAEGSVAAACEHSTPDERCAMVRGLAVCNLFEEAQYVADRLTVKDIGQLSPYGIRMLLHGEIYMQYLNGRNNKPSAPAPAPPAPAPPATAAPAPAPPAPATAAEGTVVEVAAADKQDLRMRLVAHRSLAVRSDCGFEDIAAIAYSLGFYRRDVDKANARAKLKEAERRRAAGLPELQEVNNQDEPLSLRYRTSETNEEERTLDGDATVMPADFKIDNKFFGLLAARVATICQFSKHIIQQSTDDTSSNSEPEGITAVRAATAGKDTGITAHNIAMLARGFEAVNLTASHDPKLFQFLGDVLAQEARASRFSVKDCGSLLVVAYRLKMGHTRLVSALMDLIRRNTGILNADDTVTVAQCLSHTRCRDIRVSLALANRLMAIKETVTEKNVISFCNTLLEDKFFSVFEQAEMYTIPTAVQFSGDAAAAMAAWCCRVGHPEVGRGLAQKAMSNHVRISESRSKDEEEAEGKSQQEEAPTSVQVEDVTPNPNPNPKSSLSFKGDKLLSIVGMVNVLEALDPVSDAAVFVVEQLRLHAKKSDVALRGGRKDPYGFPLAMCGTVLLHAARMPCRDPSTGKPLAAPPAVPDAAPTFIDIDDAVAASTTTTTDNGSDSTNSPQDVRAADVEAEIVSNLPPVVWTKKEKHRFFTEVCNFIADHGVLSRDNSHRPVVVLDTPAMVEIVNLLANDKVKVVPIFRLFGSKISKVMDSLNADDVCILLDSYATFGVHDDAVIKALLTRCTRYHNVILKRPDHLRIMVKVMKVYAGHQVMKDFEKKFPELGKQDKGSRGKSLPPATTAVAQEGGSEGGDYIHVDTAAGAGVAGRSAPLPVKEKRRAGDMIGDKAKYARKVTISSSPVKVEKKQDKRKQRGLGIINLRQ